MLYNFKIHVTLCQFLSKSFLKTSICVSPFLFKRCLSVEGCVSSYQAAGHKTKVLSLFAHTGAAVLLSGIVAVMPWCCESRDRVSGNLGLSALCFTLARQIHEQSCSMMHFRGPRGNLLVSQANGSYQQVSRSFSGRFGVSLMLYKSSKVNYLKSQRICQYFSQLQELPANWKVRWKLFWCSRRECTI